MGSKNTKNYYDKHSKKDGYRIERCSTVYT